MAVVYGLRRTWDFRTKLHLLGDHSDAVLETIDDDYLSETEEGNNSVPGVGLLFDTAVWVHSAS